MREQMLTEVIMTWGFEHPHTIEFAGAIDALTDSALQELYDDIMSRGLNIDEEEDF